MTNRARMAIFLLAALGLFGPARVAARNIDLATVPERDSVQLTIYNSEDLTLVRETRLVSFKRGANRLQFSWAGTLIDPTSVELEFRPPQDRLAVLDTTFPHDRPQTLYWTVESDFDGQARVEISYFTSGITWSADYVMVAGAGERAVALDGFIRIHNRSGEAYRRAEVRVVVGTINLVEKIARLARVSMEEVGALAAERKRALRAKAARKEMGVASAPAADAAAGRARAKTVTKEGLSEYFIYTVEGRESIPNGWSKRLRSFAASPVPLEIRYRYRPRIYGDRLVRMYLLRNDEGSGLGTTPLPDGTVRVFRHNGRDGLSYLATRTIRYVPVGDRMEIDLGPDPRVSFELRVLRRSRENVWLKMNRGNVYRRVTDGRLRLDRNGTVAGWDERRVFAQRVHNATGSPIELEIRREFDGDVEFRSRLGAEVHDYRTVQFTAVVAPFTRADLRFETVTRLGRNAKQRRVTVREARVEPPVY